MLEKKKKKNSPNFCWKNKNSEFYKRIDPILSLNCCCCCCCCMQWKHKCKELDLNEDTNPVSDHNSGGWYFRHGGRNFRCGGRREKCFKLWSFCGFCRGVGGESFYGVDFSKGYVGWDLAKKVVVEKFTNLFDLNDRW